MSQMRPKAKFLSVVWGKTYIARFATLALPSYLAQGNLPALAGMTDLEVVVMTRKSDIEYFEALPAFQRLRTICQVRFVEIDDLITKTVYGFTLTLAFARPIIASGREMLDTHFVFMNADFVLGDGSLAALGKQIVAGRRIVLGPSFRAIAEAVEPQLRAMVDPASGVLSIAPRRLAALSLPYPHATTIAKIVNQGFCHASHPNQFFWRVNAQTLLGRYYLIFMLCLKPERVIKKINSYCDYGFIPEMCPSGDEAVMGDSDEFFMLELQGRKEEMHLLRLGRQSEVEIALKLSEWSTAEHRRAAGHDVVFHSADIPPGIESAKAEASGFVQRIGRRLGPPVPHAGHRYWRGGVAAWQGYRRAQHLTDNPSELGPLPRPWVRFPRPLKFLLLRIFRKVRVWTAGRAPTVTPMHPYWLDYELLRKTLADILADPGRRVLVVRNDAVSIDPLLEPHASVRVATLQEALRGRIHAPRAGGFTHALIYMLRKDCRNARRLTERVQALMVPGASCHVFIHHLHGEFSSGDFSKELVLYVEDIVSWSSRASTFAFVGGGLKRFNSRMVSSLLQNLVRFELRWLPVVIPALILQTLLILLSNLWLALRLPSRYFIEHCSSVSIRIDSDPVEPRVEASSSSIE